MAKDDVMMEKLNRMHADILSIKEDVKLNTEFRITRTAETKLLWAIAAITSAAVSGLVLLLAEFGIPRLFGG